ILKGIMDDENPKIKQIKEIVQKYLHYEPARIHSTLLTDPPYENNLNSYRHVKKIYKNSIEMSHHMEPKIANFHLAKKLSDVKVNNQDDSLKIYNWAAPEMMQKCHKDEKRISLDIILSKLSELDNMSTDQPSSFVKDQNLIENLSHGLIIDMKKIHPSDSSAFTFEDDEPKTTELQARKFQAKLESSSKYKDSFLLENHIDQMIIGSEDLNWIDGTNPLNNESLVNDIYIEVQNPRIELIFKKGSIKPTENLKNEIKNALNHHNPYRELMKVFRNYGHLIPERVILGHKLYIMSHLIANASDEWTTNNKLDAKSEEWMTNEDFEIKCDEFFNHWKTHMERHYFDSSYLISIDGDIVMIKDIKTWVKNCLKGGNNFLQVISWKGLYPLYEIFDNPFRQEIKLILGNDEQTINSGIKEKVLMTGIIQTQNSITYYRVNFSNHLESNEYKIFGKLMTHDGIPNDNYVVKFKSMNIYGFSAIIESFNADCVVNFEDLQITWILIGIPSEVGVYNSDTRNISILRFKSCEFKFDPKTSFDNCNVRLKVPKNLELDSFLITSFAHPRLNYEPCFMAKIKNYYEDEIETPSNTDDDSSIDEISSENFQLEWGILLKNDRKECDKIGSDLIMPINHLEAVGQITVSLDLSYNDIDFEMGKALVVAFITNSTLTCLNLKSTRMKPEMVIDLANALNNNMHLIDLDLSYNKFTEEAGDALAKALGNNNTLKILNLCNNDIDSRIGKTLINALLKNKALVNLDLSHNNFDVDAIKILAQVLESNNNKLKILNLSFINLEFQAGMDLIESLEKNQTLEDLNLSSTKIGSISESLIDHLNSHRTFTGLNTKDNIINCVTTKNLEKALKKNATLTNLNVSSNNISSKTLVDALRQNHTLRNLNLSKNNIGPEAGEILIEILKTNHTLTSINLESTRIESNIIKALARELKDDNICLIDLNLSYNDINFEVIKVLVEALEENTTLKSLDLSHNCINLEIGKELAKSLKKNKTLNSLLLIHCNISYEVIKALKTALMHNKALTHLDLSNNNISFGAGLILKEILKTNTALKNLNLSYNEFDLESEEALAQALETNKTLTALSLRSTIIKPGTGIALANALEINETLIELDLSYNNISFEVGMALAKSLSVNNFLKKVDLSFNKSEKPYASPFCISASLLVFRKFPSLPKYQKSLAEIRKSLAEIRKGLE
ncbi:4105_t:CDS:2, partial [Cetraspora pellucida]